MPGSGQDPETGSMSVADKVRTLLAYLQRDTGSDCPVDRLLNFVIVDRAVPESQTEGLKTLGISVLRLDLVSKASAPYFDPVPLCETLVSLT